MNLSTGSRVRINGTFGSVVVTNQRGEAVFVKYDKSDHIFMVKDQTIEPIVQPALSESE